MYSDSTATVSLHCMRMREQELCDRMNGTLAVDSLFKHLCRPLRIYRLALPLHAPEMLPLFSNSRNSLFNVHLALFVRRMTLVSIVV